jgi:radical SAM protein with 4Fe4S-binding SPASM domain
MRRVVLKMSTPVIETKHGKFINTPDFHMIFNKDTGFMAVWGKDHKEDPDLCPFGPLIADIEISTVCHGGGPLCSKICYKSNTCEGSYMTLETFKTVFAKLNYNNTVTQIAFGIGDIDANPEQWEIFQYCRDHGVVPNITINGSRMNSELFTKLSSVMGAVAVSHYSDDNCFNAVKELTDRGMTQVNIHKMISEETYESCLDLLDKASTDPRLSKLNAIVFLSLKPKGRGVAMNPLRNTEAYRRLVEKALEKKIGFGFDSCGAGMFLESMKDHPEYDKFKTLAEPCESFGMSFYVNVEGKSFPCSFCEGVEPAIDFLHEDITLDSVWHGEIAQTWREKLWKNCRNCPVFDVGPKKG